MSITTPPTHSARWADLLALALFALLLRLVFFNGPFGSDDAVYLERAIAVARGDWSSSDYNGALRYAFNLPAGLLIRIFGENTAAANLWPLLCSLAEVLLVYVVAASIWGRRAGLFAGLVLATLPLHISVASRIHVDAVVSLFLSLAFALVYFGSMRDSRRLWFAAGLAMGAVYWAKELAAVTLLAFLAIPLLWRRMPPGWPWVLLGGLTMLIAHLGLMTAIAGDPLHLFRVASRHSFIAEGVGDGSAWYYFRYLLLDLRQTGLASLLAGVGVCLVLRNRSVAWTRMDGRSFVVVWWLSLLAVLSFFPVSLSPLRFAMKQSNYLTLFLAPIAILAGATLTQWTPRLAAWGIGLVALLGLLLAGLQQADYRVFTSNSKAAYAFMQAHPGHAMVGSRNTASLRDYYAALAPAGQAPRIYSLTQAITEMRAQVGQAPAPLYVAWDPQTQAWAGGGGGLKAPPACWQRDAVLVPAGLAWTNRLAATAAHWPVVPHAGAQLLARLGQPPRATVYTVAPRDLWCGQPPG